MSSPNLLDAFGTSVKNNAYKILTGLPVPGSAEDKQKQIEDLRLQKQLQAELNPKEGETAEAHRSRLAGLNDMLLKQQREQGLINLELSGGPGTTSQLDIRERLEQIRRRTEATRTQNEKDLLGAQNQAKLQLLNPVLEQERYLADHVDAEARRDVLEYFATTRDKNLAAQEAARRPNFSNIGALLGGLGMAAASLFG